MSELFSKQKEIKVVGRPKEFLNVMPPEPTPPSTPSLTPSVSVTPSITPTISITPTVTLSVSSTPTPTPSVNYYYIANRYNCYSGEDCGQFTGQVTLNSGGSALTLELFYTSSGSPNFIFQPINLDSNIIGSPLTITDLNSFNNCVDACLAINPSPTPSVTPSITPTISKTPSISPTPTVTSTPSVTITSTPSITPSITVTPTPTPSSLIYSFNLRYDSADSGSACSAGSAVTRYSDSSTLSVGYRLTTDSGLVTDAPAGYYCIDSGSCTNNKIWIYSDGSIITQNLIC